MEPLDLVLLSLFVGKVSTVIGKAVFSTHPITVMLSLSLQSFSSSFQSNSLSNYYHYCFFMSQFLESSSPIKMSNRRNVCSHTHRCAHTHTHSPNDCSLFGLITAEGAEIPENGMCPPCPSLSILLFILIVYSNKNNTEMS